MKAIFAPLTAAVTLATIVSMVTHLKPCAIAVPALPATAFHALARQWGELTSVPVKGAVDLFHHGLSRYVHEIALIERATDGDPHVMHGLRCP